MSKIILVKRYTEKLVRENPDTYFVFGDNLIKRGHGGQAIIRDYKNTIGVPTKKHPSNYERSFMNDDEFEENKEEIDISFKMIRKKLKNGFNIALPVDGLGTGLARLPEKAPKTNKYLLKKLAKLIKDYM